MSGGKDSCFDALSLFFSELGMLISIKEDVYERQVIYVILLEDGHESGN